MNALKFVDIALSSNEELLKESISLIKMLGYKSIAVDGINRYLNIDDVAVIPRETFTDAKGLVSRVGNSLKVFRVDSIDKFKLTNRVISKTHAIEVGGSLLGRLGRRNAEKLANIGAHVVVKAVEIYERLIRGKPLNGLTEILRLYEKGKILVSVGSGGNLMSGKGLNHGIVIASILINLGLSEAKAIAAVTSNPASLLRRAGYVVR